MQASSKSGASTTGMATALSIDQDQPPPSCHYEDDPELSVRFISTNIGNIPESARKQEIFLDYTGMKVSQRDVCFVLDERFDSFLSDTDRRFKQAIYQMMDNCQDATESLAFQRMDRFLRQDFGFDGLNEKLKTRMNRTIRRQEEENNIDECTSAAFSAETLPSTGSGHVFCINGSVCDLACDAFLCPVAIPKRQNRHGLVGRIFGQWRKHLMATYPEFWTRMEQTAIFDNEHFPLKRYEDYPHAASFSGWPWEEFANGSLPANLPFFVAGHVGFQYNPSKAPSLETHVMLLLETLRDALDVALLELEANQPQPQHGRERYLIAVPVLGTGGGGATDLTGHVIKHTLETLNEYATQEKIDCVLVCADPATYAQAQQIRFQQREVYPCFGEFVDQSLHDEAERLAELAGQRRLSLFLGAGVSVGSGLPTWFQFLNLLEDEFTRNGIPEERSLGDQSNWDPLVMAESLEQIAQTKVDRHGNKSSLKARVQSLLQTKSRNPGLLLYLLLALKAPSIVTQNYDTLIERAVACRNVMDNVSENHLSVIPYHPKRHASQWLLKMHGCVSKPQDIVLTESDYQDYEAGRLRALSGLVQANLMTSHFLFCGFSMTDPNYLRILGEVRHALKPENVENDSI